MKRFIDFLKEGPRFLYRSYNHAEYTVYGRHVDELEVKLKKVKIPYSKEQARHSGYFHFRIPLDYVESFVDLLNDLKVTYVREQANNIDESIVVKSTKAKITFAGSSQTKQVPTIYVKGKPLGMVYFDTKFKSKGGSYMATYDKTYHSSLQKAVQHTLKVSGNKGTVIYNVNEVSPPGGSYEKWIKDNKERFIQKYGEKEGLSRLYARAWNMKNKFKTYE